MRYLVTMLIHSAIPQNIGSNQIVLDLDPNNPEDAGTIQLLNDVNSVYSTPDGVSVFTQEANAQNQSEGMKQQLNEARELVESAELVEDIANDQDDSEIKLITFGTHI